MNVRGVTILVAAFAALAQSQTASAAPLFQQGFETDASGWLDNDDFSGFGDVTQVASGTNGVTSSSGSFHGLFTQTAPTPPNAGPFTRFDMYRSTWPGSFAARNDIYLDTGWSAGEGFDYSVAANGTDGAHERDFIFHVTKDTSTGDLLVGGSNNTNFDPREDLETLNHYVVGATGWYTFEHSFYDSGLGVLAVDLNLYDSSGTLLFTETRSNPSDIIGGTVGGNRYGWFTNIDIAGGIAVDNTSLTAVPEPTSLGLLAFGATLLAGRSLRRRRRENRQPAADDV